MEQVTDRELARRLQGGDGGAFEQLVERYQDRLYRLAKAMLFHADGAEDAVQEVFVRAYGGLPRFQFRSSLYTWLYATLRNVCHEMNRRQDNLTAPLNVEPVDERNVPERRVQATERLERVMNVVRELPERQRDVVLLRLFEGHSVAETAKILRCREGTVKAHLNRAMQRLKTLETPQ